jgi:hypothetical protein
MRNAHPGMRHEARARKDGFPLAFAARWRFRPVGFFVLSRNWKKSVIDAA